MQDYMKETLTEQQKKEVLGFIRSHYEVTDEQNISISRSLNSNFVKDEYKKYIEENPSLIYEEVDEIKYNFEESLMKSPAMNIVKRQDYGELSIDIAKNLSFSSDAIYDYLNDSDTIELSYTKDLDAHFNTMESENFLTEVAIDTHLKNKEYVTNKSITLFHHYEDSLAPQMEEFLGEISSITPSFKDDFIDYCIADDTLQNYLADNLWESYARPTANALHLNEAEVYNYITDNYEIDDNLNSLLDVTPMPTVAIYVGKTNWDDAYFDNIIFELAGSQEQGIHAPNRQSFALDMNADMFKHVLDTHSADELQESLNKTMIPWLIQSQGYELSDLYDAEKVEQSKFLSSLKKDMAEMSANNFVGYELVFVAGNENNSIDTLSKSVNEHGDISLDHRVEVGFHNRIHGYSTPLEIKLEQPIVIPNEYIQRNMVYDSRYTPDVDLGLYPSDVGSFSPIEGKTPFKEHTTNLQAIVTALEKNERTVEAKKETPTLNFIKSTSDKGLER